MQRRHVSEIIIDDGARHAAELANQKQLQAQQPSPAAPTSTFSAAAKRRAWQLITPENM